MKIIQSCTSKKVKKSKMFKGENRVIVVEEGTEFVYDNSEGGQQP